MLHKRLAKFHDGNILLTMSSRTIDPRKKATLDLIDRLINCMVNIKDETGEFLLHLEDGRVIDTKGWNDWEVSHTSCGNLGRTDWRHSGHME